MKFWNEYKGWIMTAVVVIAIICACTLECGPVIWLGLLAVWVVAAFRAQDEREVQEERWKRGYRDDD